MEAAGRAWNLILPACDGGRLASHAAGQVLAIEEFTWSNKAEKLSGDEKEEGLEWKGVSTGRGVVTRLLSPGFGWQVCGESAFCGVAGKLELILWKRNGGWSTIVSSGSALRQLKSADCAAVEKMARVQVPEDVPRLQATLDFRLIPDPCRWEPPVPAATLLAAVSAPIPAAAPTPVPVPTVATRRVALTPQTRNQRVWLQVAAVSEEHSRELAERLRREGLPVITENVPDKVLVRVIIGPVDPSAQETVEGWGITPFRTKPR